MSEPPWETIVVLHSPKTKWWGKQDERTVILCADIGGLEICPGCQSVNKTFYSREQAAKWYCEFYKLGPYSPTCEGNHE